MLSLLPHCYARVTDILVHSTQSFRYGIGAYETAINLVGTGKINVSKIVTHRYTFEDCIKAFDATAKGKGEDGKAVIKVQICQGDAQ